MTSGPGATNLVTGIATANYDSAPLVCFTGQVPTYLIGNDAFQEVDIVGITRSISKYAVTVRRREDLAAAIKKAFYIARSGKPGVVVVDIPKDIQQELGSDIYPESIEVRGYKPNTSVEPTNRKQMLTSGGPGTMGYDFPAAIGAKLGNPDKDVITICGVGGF